MARRQNENDDFFVAKMTRKQNEKRKKKIGCTFLRDSIL